MSSSNMLIGFIDKRNVDICTDMFNSLGVQYQITDYGWGFKFTNPTKELKDDIVQYLRVDSSEAKIWPISDHDLHRKIQKTGKSYYDLITLDDNNKQVIREYIIQKRISTQGSRRGLSAIIVFAIDFTRLEFNFFRHACDLMIQAEKGQYKTAISTASSDFRSGKYKRDFDAKLTKNEIYQICETGIKESVLKHINLSIENYPPPLYSVEGMGTKSLQQRSARKKAGTGLLGF